jgi:hypothetical protein
MAGHNYEKFIENKIFMICYPKIFKEVIENKIIAIFISEIIFCSCSRCGSNAISVAG